MKLLGKTKDGAIDGLLRAYVSRSGNLPHVCPDFDPDLANAYIERSLPADSRSRYEQHLSDCGACRKSVVALARLAEAEGATSTASIPSRASEARPAWLRRMARGLSGLTAPQWATAVAAVIVLAITLPLVLSRSEAPRTTQVAATATAESQQSSEARTSDQIAGTVPPAAVQKPVTGTAANTKQSGKREAETMAANTPVAQPASVAGNVSSGGRADAIKAKPAAPVDEIQAKTDRPAETVAVRAGAASESQLAKNESDKKQKEKDSAQPGEAKAASAGEAGAGKEVASKVAEPPPPATRSTPEPSRSRKGLREPGKLGLRDTSSEVARLPEKKIQSKKFLLRDDVWTDKDYDPDKNQPVVNLVRDSNVYKEVIGKQTGLKAYLDAFREGERAIIVYKGKVYKLIPQ
jgi:hypothetical protein